MLDIEIKRSKVVSKLIADVAKENNLRHFAKGDIDKNFTEEQFNSIIWFSPDVLFFNEETVENLGSPITWQEFNARMQVELSKVDYMYNRLSEYPPVAEQLDMIFKDVDAWRSTIQAIKDKYPKGE